MERRHIDLGPGRIYGADGMTLFDVKEASFEDITTTPGPAAAKDARIRAASFPEPIELSFTIRTERRWRFLAAALIGWRANGPVRLRALEGAAKSMIKHRKRSEIF